MKTTAVRRAIEDPESGWPSHEAIAERAYELYMERPAQMGSPLEDWLRAERELTQTQPVGSRRRRGTLRVMGPDLTSK